jgi:hypothetical protein
MSVGRADANGSGSSVGSAAPAKPNDGVVKPPAAKPTPGLAGGKSTTWTQAPLQFHEIDEALDHLSAHEKSARPADRQELDSEQTLARLDLSIAIKNTIKGASLHLTSAEVRKRSAEIAAHYKGRPGEKAVNDEIDIQQLSRIANDVSVLSGATDTTPSSVATERAIDKSFKTIFDDAADYVTRRRWDEAGLAPDKVKENQFHRLENFLKAVTQEEPPPDPATFAMSITACVRAMHVSGTADIARLEQIVGKFDKPVPNYGNQNQDILIWIGLLKEGRVK